MRNPNRIPVFMSTLSAVWQTYAPDLRFCQFILNEMENFKHENNIEDCFYVEDEKFLSFIINKYKGDRK